MTAVDSFVRHPRTFMRSNVVMISGTNAHRPGGPQAFSLVPARGMTALNMTAVGQPQMPVYVLKPYVGNGQQVNAHWCPFEMNDYQGTTLPGNGGPEFMFTYMMDGCTFSAGSVTGDKTVSVFHINMSNSNGAGGGGAIGLEQQRKLQRNIGKSVASGAQMVDPDDYMDGNHAVAVPQDAKIATVTFGRRSSNDGWKFYTHQWYTVAGDRMRLRFMGTNRAI